MAHTRVPSRGHEINFMEPSKDNDFLASHIGLLLRCYHQLTGVHLIAPEKSQIELARKIYHAPFVLLSHGTGPDPILTYGNLTAQRLFSMPWETLTKTPSRLTAETPNQKKRQELLDEVTQQGFINDYSGTRISACGKRFQINQATVWNLTDESGALVGQAAAFAEWSDNLS
ncbi:MAG: MEKHLA domain-containing protein [Akkermansiaceae bacterium]